VPEVLGELLEPGPVLLVRPQEHVAELLGPVPEMLGCARYVLLGPVLLLNDLNVEVLDVGSNVGSDVGSDVGSGAAAVER